MKKWLTYLVMLALVFTAYGALIQDVWAADQAPKQKTLWQRSSSTTMAGWLIVPKKRIAPKAVGSKRKVVYSDEKLVIIDPFED